MHNVYKIGTKSRDEIYNREIDLIQDGLFGLAS
jgi:hypothetical protein